MRIVGHIRADLYLAKVKWRRAEATREGEIKRQIASDPDTAPLFSAAELRRARRVVPELAAENVRAIRHRLGPCYP